MINIPKGTYDILPKDSYKWHKLKENISNIARKYNLKEIVTPMFEHTELFVRGAGNSSDVVNKEMYTFIDKGERSLTLKPESTASVARSFIENGLFNESMPIKFYYISPCFRYEKPQKGRYRQHTQFGLEIYGSNHVLSEVETFLIAKDFFNSLGIDITIVINNLGCEDCRTKYKEKLKDYVESHLPDMCPDCHRRYETNPLRMLDCKSNECKAILKDAPRINDCLCDECNDYFNKIVKYLDALNIKYKIDNSLVRGFDYYTNIVFEFYDGDSTRSQSALGGGGRYNHLVEELGGKPTPVIGFGLGLERILLYLEDLGKTFEDDENVDCYVASITDNVEYVLNLVKDLRKNDISCDYDIVGRGLKAQFKYADKIKAKYVITVGDNEIESNTLIVKNMLNGTQEQVNANDIVNYLKG